MKKKLTICSVNFFFVAIKLIEYIFSAVNVCSNPCVGPFPRTNISKYVFCPIINISGRTHISTKN